MYWSWYSARTACKCSSPRISIRSSSSRRRVPIKALAGRVHPRCLDGGVQDAGTRGLEDGVEGAGEVRSAVADQEPEVVETLVESEGQVAGLLHGPLPGGMCSDAAQVHLAGAMLDEHQDI